MKKINVFFDGKKTYIIVVMTWAFAISGYFTGHLGLQEALNLVIGTGVAGTLRSAMTSIENAVKGVKKAYTDDAKVSQLG